MSIGSNAFDYDVAFSRNLGLTQPSEQQKLRNSCVAIAGMGGVGGIHLITLARMGVGKFHIADFDRFELHNFNRQSGAMMSTIDADKAQTMKDMVLDINPEAEVTIFPEGITEATVASFFDGVDVAIDGLDYFAVDARDQYYREAVRREVAVVAVGPIGCSAALLVFVPGGMTWHDYFAMELAKDNYDKYVLFALGTAPKATQLDYLDRNFLNLSEQRAPSLAPAVQLCAGVAGAEVLKLLLGRGRINAVPFYSQFDAYKCRFARGRLRWGNKGPVQRLKFQIFRRLYKAKLAEEASSTGR
ncbi:MAG: ThiF family adenylyltransferase [Pseudomonadota bacterium]